MLVVEPTTKVSAPPAPPDDSQPDSTRIAATGHPKILRCLLTKSGPVDDVLEIKWENDRVKTVGIAHALVRGLKNVLVANEIRLHRVLFGFAAGARLPLNFHNQAHIVLGMYEKEVRELLEQAVRAETVLYDVGAGYGYYVIAVGRKASSGYVYAFEADPPTLEYLAQAIEANHLESRVDVVPAFVSSSEGPGQVSLDGFVAAGSPREPDLLKIDVEGAEADVLRGAMKLVQSSRPVLFIETHSQEVDEECQKLLADLGYEMTFIEHTGIKEARTLDFNRWIWAEPTRLGA